MAPVYTPSLYETWKRERWGSLKALHDQRSPEITADFDLFCWMVYDGHPDVRKVPRPVQPWPNWPD